MNTRINIRHKTEEGIFDDLLDKMINYIDALFINKIPYLIELFCFIHSSIMIFRQFPNNQKVILVNG